MAVNIADFNWDEQDGFETVVDDDTTDDKTKPAKVDATTSKEGDKSKDSEDEFEINFDTGTDADDSKTDTSTTIEDTTFKTLKEKNLFTVELEEGDDLETAWDKQITKDVDDAITEMFSELKKDKEAIALIKHLKEGGNAVSYTHLTLPTNREV